ncbi:4-hydroxythreonine-4-phosphate dehydrogenase [Helicobacter burdigaliensis]|uniref:4-hydroxythreonine-4-phosphate dehydrogenase n=1 Tax=Helicobacter burdigaliensis TaxID=2315334 RepID=UPI000EF74831|nr:4-hydroxythreonine-4-phosphate dehydrogenase [Helicobacter burdigaliensis]
MKIAVSVGDINGVGLEILLKSHKKIKQFCTPIYCVDRELLEEASDKLKRKLPKNLELYSPKNLNKNLEIPKISSGTICKESGAYSYESFKSAVFLTQNKETKALVTLPIHKKAWQLAGISYAGHTEALRDMFKKDTIMVLGSPKMYVALFSDHVRLKDVPQAINYENLLEFFLNLAAFIKKPPCGVLGLNPHAGDFGVLGDEEVIINKALQEANKILGKAIYKGALVPDVAFIGKHLKYYVAMYHDQGLIPLKTLYFDKSINISLNLPIIRTSVDHGSAFDIAYQNKAKIKSYLCAIKVACKLSKATKIK